MKCKVWNRTSAAIEKDEISVDPNDVLRIEDRVWIDKGGRPVPGCRVYRKSDEGKTPLNLANTGDEVRKGLKYTPPPAPAAA